MNLNNEALAGGVRQLLLLESTVLMISRGLTLEDIYRRLLSMLRIAVPQQGGTE